MNDIKIRLLAMDVDGTLTDGKVYIGETGEIMKAFDIKDGYAIYKILPECGIVPAVITGRTSDIVRWRCEELGIQELYQNSLDKKSVLVQLAKKYDLTIDDTGVIKGCAFIGDDLLDIPAMEVSQISGCPADAAQEVKQRVNYICSKNGGSGSVREFVEWIIRT